MEQNFLGRPLDPSETHDPHSNMRHEFGKIFQEGHLGDFANPADLGFADLSKSYYPPFNSHPDDHPKGLDADNSHNPRVPVPREDLGPYQMNPSSYGLAHHGAGHYNPNYNANFGFNGVKPQQFSQDHLGYPDPSYYYQNPHHYDSHGVQPNRGGHVDYHPYDNFMGAGSLSRMWDDNPNKPINYKNMQMNGWDHVEMKGNQGFSSYEPGSDPRLYQNIHDYDAKRNHMLRMPQEMAMGQGRKGLEAQQSGLYPGFQNSQMPMAKGAVSQPKYAPTKLSPKKGGQTTNLDVFDDGDNDAEDGDEKGRSTRGLRVLSLKVKEIVTQKKRTSYKEVAESLTHELRQKTNGKPLKEESKDEQNVKRRVYDALNVLIAAGVLRKEGKVVYCDQAMAGVGASSKKQKDDKDKILRDIEEAKKRNKAKIELLHELVFKCLAIKNLIKNNKARLEAESNPENKLKPRTSSVNATRIEVIQENPSLRPKNEDVIRFPFIVLLSSSPENSMNLNMDTQQKQLAIESKKPFNIFGDIDVLLKMGLHYVSRKMFDENIPIELQKFVPKYFLAALN